MNYKHKSSNHLQSFAAQHKPWDQPGIKASPTTRQNTTRAPAYAHTYADVSAGVRWPSPALLPEQLLASVTACSSPGATIMYNSPLSFIKIIIRWGERRSLAVKWHIWGQGESSFRDGAALWVVAKPPHAGWWGGRGDGGREKARGGGGGGSRGGGGAASADARRQTASPERHESCRSLRQLSPSPPPTPPPLPLPSVKHTHALTHTHTH